MITPAEGEQVYEVGYGHGDRQVGTVWVSAPDDKTATERARAQLVDVGVLPGPMHEAWLRFVKATS